MRLLIPFALCALFALASAPVLAASLVDPSVLIEDDDTPEIGALAIDLYEAGVIDLAADLAVDLETRGVVSVAIPVSSVDGDTVAVLVLHYGEAVDRPERSNRSGTPDDHPVDLHARARELGVVPRVDHRLRC